MDRGAMLTLFQLHAVRHVSKPAAVNFTPRMGLLASVQLCNTIRCGDFVVFLPIRSGDHDDT